MADRKGYATVYWGKMPVNFRPQDFPKHEVEAAIGYAERSFRDVSGLVPDFSVLTLGAGPEGAIEAALVLGDEREAGSSGAAGKSTGASTGCCGRSRCASGRGAGGGRGTGTPGPGERPPSPRRPGPLDRGRAPFRYTPPGRAALARAPARPFRARLLTSP